MEEIIKVLDEEIRRNLAIASITSDVLLKSDYLWKAKMFQQAIIYLEEK